MLRGLVLTFKNRVLLMMLVILLALPGVLQANNRGWMDMWNCNTVDCFVWFLNNTIGGWLIWV